MNQEPGRASGALVLIVGPSGVGKDSLIAYCRSRLAENRAIVFPRRAITRSDGDGFEDHETISEETFRKSVGEGAFCLSWRAHGLGYGVPLSIEADLAAGRTVVVNVSRSVLDEARRRFARLVVVSVTAPRAVVAERLRSRSRESGDGIHRRLTRNDGLGVNGHDVVTLDNSGPLETAGATLLRIVTGRAI